MFDFGVDYIDAGGRYGCQAFKIGEAPDRDLALWTLIGHLCAMGKTPYAIYHVHGDHPTAELKTILESKEAAAGETFEVIWVDGPLLIESFEDEAQKAKRRH